MTDQSSINNTDGNIHFFLDDILDTNYSENSNNFDINELLLQIEDQQLYNNEMALPQIINYNENFTVKELLIMRLYLNDKICGFI